MLFLKHFTAAVRQQTDLRECVHVSTLFQINPGRLPDCLSQNCSQNHISTELKVAESSASNNKPAGDKSD